MCGCGQTPSAESPCPCPGETCEWYATSHSTDYDGGGGGEPRRQIEISKYAGNDN